LSLDKCQLVKARFNATRAARAQTILSNLISIEDELEKLDVVAGLDVSYFNINGVEYGVGVMVTLKYPELKPQRCFYTVRRVCVPYIPGLLAFREMEVLAPLLVHGLSEVNVDLILVDGHGIAHPRGFGIASHVGLAFNLPSIGVAKRLLAGREELVGGRILIIHEGRVVGGVLETEHGKLYISPGHRVSVDTSIKLVGTMIRRGSRLPEPTRLADEISKRLKKSRPSVGSKECTGALLTAFT